MYEPTSERANEPKHRRKILFSALLVFHQGLDSYSSAIPRTVLGGPTSIRGQTTSWPEQGVEMHASAGDHAGENNGHRFL